jgi:hypothetical protein
VAYEGIGAPVAPGEVLRLETEDRLAGQLWDEHMRPIGALALKARSRFSLDGGCTTEAEERSERAEVARRGGCRRRAA